MGASESPSYPFASAYLAVDLSRRRLARLYPSYRRIVDGNCRLLMTAKIVQTDRFWIAAITGLLLIPLPIRLSKEPLIFPRSMARLGAVHGTRRERGFGGVLLETSLARFGNDRCRFVLYPGRARRNLRQSESRMGCAEFWGGFPPTSFSFLPEYCCTGSGRRDSHALA